MSLYNGENNITHNSLKIITKEISIKFYQWMKENDTLENAEKYLNYSDSDMFDEFFKTLIDN
jgi:hypothetical protein